MSGLEERERAVELYFTTPMTTGLWSIWGQCLALAGDGLYAGYGQPIIPLGAGRKGSRAGAGRHAAEEGRRTARRGRCMASGRTARAAWPRCSQKQELPRRASPRTPPPASAADDDDAEAFAPREPELGNAGEVVEARRKDPGADLRRLSNKKTLLIDRLRPAYSLSFDDSLLAMTKTPGSALIRRTQGRGGRGVADSKGRYGYRRIKAVLKTGVSEKDPQDHGGGRARGARAQATQV